MQAKDIPIKLDLVQPSHIVARPIQGETGARLNVQLLNNGVAYSVENADNIIASFKRPDDTSSYLDKNSDPAVVIEEAEQGKISMFLTNQILNKSGEVLCEVQIIGDIDGSEKVVKSWLFRLYVQPSAGHAELESRNEVSVFQQLVDDAVDAAEDGLIDRVKEEITDDLDAQLAQTALEINAVFATLAEEGDDWEVSE